MQNKRRGHYIFVKSVKTGRIIYAYNYGLKAFKIWVNN